MEGSRVGPEQIDVNGAKLPAWIAQDFIAKAKWPLLIHTKNQAVSDSAA
jgi:hypothetical protein